MIPEHPRILTIDDNSAVRRLYGEALLLDGWQVDEASDGWTGIDRAAELNPDVILMDIRLPDIGGVELLNRLRLLPGGASRPIVVASGLARELDELRQNEIPGIFCLRKPISIGELRQVIRQAPKELTWGADSPSGPPGPAARGLAAG